MDPIDKSDFPNALIVENALGSILRNSCHFSCRAVADDYEYLFDEETIYILSANVSQRREFMAGRNAARELLSRLNIAAVAIPMGSYNAPCWPSGIVGSISHCANYVICAINYVERASAVGIDIARTDHVDKDLVNREISEADNIFLREMEFRFGVSSFAILASLKNSFCRYQYTRTGEWIHANEIAIIKHDRGWTVDVRQLRANLSQLVGSWSAVGNYTVVGPFVISAFVR